jgi:hypothetical protein
MNPILEMIIEKRNGMYIHAVEVENAYELESIFEQLVQEFENDYTSEVIQDFIDTLQIYYLGENEEEEKEVYKTFQEFKINN